MRQNCLKSILVILVGLTIASCRKYTMPPGPTVGASPITGLYILNDGLVDVSSLLFYNLSTRQVTLDQYLAVNGKPLGNMANDLEIYGSKMYIVVANSNVVDIVNPKTGKLIKQDSLVNAVIGPPWYDHDKVPRNIAFYKGNAYISCHDGTVAVMDTVTLSINTTITLPGFFYQEGLVIANNKLYVADAGLGVTNTVSVIDLATNKEIKRIPVIPDPISLASDNYDNVYVMSSYTDDFQNYNISPGGMTIIDSKTDNVRPAPIVAAGNIEKTSIPITVNGDLVYYATGDNKIAIYNAKTQAPVSASFVTDGTFIQCPYSITVNSATGEVYIGDAKGDVSNGSIDVFDKTGKLEYSFPTGVFPVKIKLLD
jgi:YVTN family beta-propeller protein